MRNDSTTITLNVVEIFKSIQGEGANTGKAAIFIRLACCNMDCWFCDTEWSQGRIMKISEILEDVKKLSTPENSSKILLIWTGGEPTLQLTDEILEHFDGFYNCIETNGSNPIPARIEYISCSPKVSAELLRKNFQHVNEFRFPLQAGDPLPDISQLPQADNYFISPIFLGEVKKRFQQIDENVIYCIELIKNNPQWRLSLQIHKLLGIP